MSQRPFQAVRTEDGVLVVEGDVDGRGLDALRHELRCLVDGGSGIVDVSATTFFPSAAIAVIVRYQRAAAAAGHRLELRAAPGTIAHRVLVITGLIQA